MPTTSWSSRSSWFARQHFVIFALERKNEKNRQLLGRDVLRGIPMTLLDKIAYDQLAPGDLIAAYMFSVGDMWRPLGIVEDGGTLCCCCADADRCHRSVAAEVLAASGWRVVLDGVEVRG